MRFSNNSTLNTRAGNTVAPFRVLLIGNYPNDQQESMQRFATMLIDGFMANGLQAEIMIPTPVFGGLKPSGSGLGKWLGYLDKFIVFPLQLKLKLRNQLRSSEELVVHICDHSNSTYTAYLQRIPHVVTCHDLLAVRSALGEIPKNPTRWSGKQLQAMVLKGLKSAQHIACDSEATRQDALRLSGAKQEQISKINVALNYPYRPMPANEAHMRIAQLMLRSGAQSAVDVSGGFILHVGGNQWYKNRLGVLRIYSRLVRVEPETPPLVMVGKPFTPEMITFVEQNHLKDRVLSLERCDNEDLRALYSTAFVLLFPSLAEGFGWPVIEAQACGCPVVCSNVEPFPEVAGDAAILCNPENESEFVTAISLLKQADVRQSLVSKGIKNIKRFTPEIMIENYIHLYHSLLYNRSCRGIHKHR
jgi:glycosyltransferase involved in cell wall biosynthesis